jgi:cold shock CspA family protein/Tfp pilus assembly protein PilE
MFLEGKIKKYNTERGFGFIDVDGDQADVFFHIKDFPKTAGEPKIGEKLKFLIVEDNGKFKAANIVRLDLKTVSTNYPNHSDNGASDPKLMLKPTQSSKKGMAFTIVGLIIIAILAGLVFQKYQTFQQAKALKTAQLIEEQKRIVEQQREAVGELPEVKLSEKTEHALKAPSTPPVQTYNASPVTATQKFSCDGRQHCSQMRSLEEARWFVRNCPNTKMDGDNDGEPCENDSRWR